jgi:uncharacterized protein YcgI (DUF1989 family)
MDGVAQRVAVPAREGRAFRIAAGTRFRVIDVDGTQCGDLFAYSADDIAEYASAPHTRVHVNRLFPRAGQQFVTNRRRPILLLERDDSPGVHDMLVAACDPARYALLGVAGWHASCQENLQGAMRAFGFDRVEVPQPINLFTNIALLEDGGLDWRPALTRPGDSVTLRAEMNSIIVVSACPQDIVAINDRRPTPLAVEILA